ncbi:MAG: replication restart DNA helicase PriA [Cyanobacteria bacterium J06627_28]
MLTDQSVNCPNCGGLAERQYFEASSCGSDQSNAANQIVMQTRCHSCDYSLSFCLSSGLVLESYAPGLRADLAETTAAHCTI